jgi:prolyl 4-hydroxylase
MQSFTPEDEIWIDENLILKNCIATLRGQLIQKGYDLIKIKEKLNCKYLTGNEGFEDVDEAWIQENLDLNNCKIALRDILITKFYDYKMINRRLGFPEFEMTKDIDIKNEKEQWGTIRTGEKIYSDKLEIFKIDNFLTTSECEEIISIINNQNLTNSTTVSDSYTSVVSNSRTSKTCHFNNNIYPIIQDLEKRICKTICIDEKFSETIQGQKYEIGNEFKIHSDCFSDNIIKNDKIIQRTWTFMLYLNDVEEGGFTSFPYAYVSCKPKTGTAIIWNNKNQDGSVNTYANHCGMPVIKGTKYILTKWFKEAYQSTDISPVLRKHNYLPIFHKVGFEKINIKLESVKKIKQWMNKNKKNFITEVFSNDDIVKAGMKSSVLQFDNAPEQLKNDLIDEIQKILIKWINYKSELIHTSTYGIREYQNGSILANHYDRINTHAISAIIHLDDDSEQPWPLHIEDHNYKTHEITMKYGDIVLYESTTCYHGRPTPFIGKYYRNMYIHFKPLKWEDYTK